MDKRTDFPAAARGCTHRTSPLSLLCALSAGRPPRCNTGQPKCPDSHDRYTPISDSERVGSFELLVKRYPKGAASQYLYSRKVGDKVEFKHMQGNIKRQYPFDGKQNFTLLAAGTGITPMYQALRKLMNTPGDTRKVTLVCGNKSVADILLLPELEEMVKAHPDRLKVVHVIGNTPDDPPPEKWDHKAEVAGGWIDEAKIKKYCPPPADDALVFVCGLPGMYKALCGPREEAELAEGSVLQRLGYSKDMVAKM